MKKFMVMLLAAGVIAFGALASNADEVQTAAPQQQQESCQCCPEGCTCGDCDKCKADKCTCGECEKCKAGKCDCGKPDCKCNEAPADCDCCKEGCTCGDCDKCKTDKCDCGKCDKCQADKECKKGCKVKKSK